MSCNFFNEHILNAFQSRHHKSPIKKPQHKSIFGVDVGILTNSFVRVQCKCKFWCSYAWNATFNFQFKRFVVYGLFIIRHFIQANLMTLSRDFFLSFTVVNIDNKETHRTKNRSKAMHRPHTHTHTRRIHARRWFFIHLFFLSLANVFWLEALLKPSTHSFG